MYCSVLTLIRAVGVNVAVVPGGVSSVNLQGGGTEEFTVVGRAGRVGDMVWDKIKQVNLFC